MTVALAPAPRTAVTLEKDPTRITWYLGVVTDMGTPDAKVHNLVIVEDARYEVQIEEGYALAKKINGASVHTLLGNDRSEAYRAARTGQDTEALIDLWFAQQPSSHPVELATV